MDSPLQPNEAAARDTDCRVGPLTIGQIWAAVRSGMWLEPETRFSVDGGAESTLQEITQVVTKRLQEIQAMPSGATVEFCDVVGQGMRNTILTSSVPELQSLLAALESLSSPWRKLPPELLVEIFTWCIPPHEALSTSSAPLLLTRICSRWYDLSVNTPSLWTSIILAENFLIHQVHLHSAIDFENKWRRTDSSDFNIKRADFISRILDRSRALPLSLSTHSRLFSCPHASNLLHELVSRSKHLALLFPEPKGRHRPSVPVTSIPLATPFLESLDLYAPHFRGPPRQDSDWVLPFMNLIRSSLNTLRRLNVITGVTNWPFTGSGLHWELLTHITWMPVILTSDVVDLFRSAPNLVHACFPYIQDGFIETTREPVLLRRLETLITRAEGLFNSITLPNLRHLVLLKSSDREKNALIAFFQRSACSLETLYLYGATYSNPRALLDILENVEGGASSSNEKKTRTEKGHLKALLIADHDDESYNLFSDDFMARLTWVPGSPQGDMVLFPGLEYLSLYYIGRSAAGKLAELLLSRSIDVRSTIENIEKIHIPTLPTKLKVFESWHPDAHLNCFMDWSAIEELREEGLVLRTFKTGDSKSCMTNAEKVVLKRYVEEEGLVVRDYLHDIGQFTPILLQEEVD